MLNPVHLRTLAAVLRSGSFAVAARELGYTASAVSQQMSALESATGLQLFERSARAVYPTDTAETLLEKARPMLVLLDSLEDDVRALAGGRAGRLRLGSFPTASEHIVPEVLARLAVRLPEVQVVLDEAEPDVLIPMVADRRVDLALTYDYALVPRTWPRNVARTTLLIEDLVLIVPRHHRLAGVEEVSLAELAEDVWISTAPDTAGAQCLERACGQVGFAPRVDYRTNDYDVVRRLVRANLGIALVPALGHECQPGVVALRLVAPQLHRRVIAAQRRVGGNPLAALAVEACQRVAAKLSERPQIRRG